MARIDDAVQKARLLLHPEEAPLPSDDEIAELLEMGATRLENATTRTRQVDRATKRLSLAKEAMQAAKSKEAELPTKAKVVHDLKDEVENLVLEDGPA